MAAREKVTFVISARDRASAVFRRIRRSFRRMRLGVVGLAGSIAAAFGVTRVLNFAVALETAASTLDVGIQKLQAFAVVARNLGIPFGQVVDNLRQLTSSIGEALGGGSEKLVRVFERLGISFKELQTSDIIDLVEKLAGSGEEASKRGRGALRIWQRDLRKVIGETGVNFTAALRKGPEAFRAALKAAIEGGQTQTKEEIARLAKLKREIDSLLKKLQVILIGKLLEFMPKAIRAVEEMVDLVREGVELLKQNKNNIVEGAKETAKTGASFAASPIGALLGKLIKEGSATTALQRNDLPRDLIAAVKAAGPELKQIRQQLQRGAGVALTSR